MAIALLLAAAKRLIPADRRIRQHDWRPRGLPFAGAQVARSPTRWPGPVQSASLGSLGLHPSQVDPPEPMVMLDGRTALVLGLGARASACQAAGGRHALTRPPVPRGGVGSRVAAVCAALGMAVLATKRSARLGGEGGGSGIEVHHCRQSGEQSALMSRWVACD